MKRNNSRVTLSCTALEARENPANFVVSNGNDAGAGSLRQAIVDANAAGGADTITFASNVTNVILSSGPLALAQTASNSSVAIYGPNAGNVTIQRASTAAAFRVFDIPASGVADFRNITISGGLAPSGENGGGIRNAGKLTLINVTLQGNTVSGTTAAISSGGALAAVTGSNSLLYKITITNNIASTNAQYGGIFNQGSMAITSATISNNTGSAIGNNGDLTIFDATFSQNSTAGNGGAIFNSGTSVQVYESTFVGNSSSNDGGAVFTQTTFSAINSTFSANSATGSGSAIYNRSEAYIGDSTFTLNRANASGGTSNGNGAIFTVDNTASDPNNKTILQNSIVGGNFVGVGSTASDIGNTATSSARPLNLAANSQNNLIGDTSSSGGLVNNVNGNIVGVSNMNAVINPTLALNGGTTLTHALVAGSRAIDAGSNTQAVDSQGKALIYDQRLYNRITNTTVDIGAVEYSTNQSPTVSPFVINATTGQTVNFTVANFTGHYSDPESNALTSILVTTLPLPNSGQLLLNGTPITLGQQVPAAQLGQITFVPAAGFAGTTSFQFTGGDGTSFAQNDATISIVYPTVTTNPLLVGVPNFAVGADAGSPPTVNYYNSDGTLKFTTTAFASSFTGGVRTAVGDFNGDGVPDLVVGTGPGIATQVKILDGVTQNTLFTVNPFESTFTGGVYVAAGDINGDGTPDLVITPDQGGGPRARVFNGRTFAVLADFFGIDDPNFRGGARAAIGDVNGDGKGDLVIAAGFGGGPRIAVFDGSQLGSNGGPKLFGDFFAFEDSLRNGTYVSVGDVNGDGRADLVVGAGPGGGPRVSVFNGLSLMVNTQTRISDFFAGDVNSRGGVRVAVKNLDNTTLASVVTGSGTASGSQVVAYSGSALLTSSPTPSLNFAAFPGFSGGVYVG